MSPQLYDVCKQFEQVFLASLVPESIASFGTSRASEVSDDGAYDFHVESKTMSALFAQTFAEALERSGGLGLAGELYRSMSERKS